MDKNHIVKEISYFKDCYIADNRTQLIEKLRSAKIEHLGFLNNDSILRGFELGAPIKSEKAQEILTDLKIYTKEKELRVFFLGLRSTARSVAPLFIYPAQIKLKNGGYFISTDLSKVEVNYVGIEKMILDKDQAQVLTMQLGALVNNNYVNISLMTELESIVESYGLSLSLAPYPTKDVQLAKIIRKESPTAILKILAYGVMRKSANTRGVINELNHLINTKNYSKTLKSLFGSYSIRSPKLNKDLRFLPFTLSHGQEQVFEAVNFNPLSLMIGPPGTGKTFTIIALALEAIRTGKSILICTKTDQALDVIHQKIENELEEDAPVIRYGRGNYKKELSEILSGIIDGSKTKPMDKNTVERIRGEAKDFYKILYKLETEIDNLIYLEAEYGALVYGHSNGILDSIKEKIYEIQLKPMDRLQELIERLEKTHSSRKRINKNLLITEYQFRIFKNLKAIKAQLKSFSSGIKARTGSRQERHFDSINFKELLKVFPLWLVNLSDLESCLPLQKEIFDLLIIDEGSQSEVTLALPAFQRSKSALIAGDPKQLRHVSFLSQKVQEEFLRNNDLEATKRSYHDYRNFSILDMVNEVTFNENNIGFLQEHYRSQPSIISFNNHHFYDGSLRIMTSHTEQLVEKNIELIHVSNGVNQLNVNLQEIDLIKLTISELIINTPKSNNYKSIGILSPFKDQVEAIRSMVKKSFTIELLEKHDILIGTPYAFQGEEKEIMILSMCLTDESPPGSFAYLSKENVFNVSTSRAKSKQIVLYSFTHKNLPKTSLIRKYLEHNHELRAEKLIERDVFIKEVEKELMENNYSSIKIDEYVAGMPIDLYVKGKNHHICIDLIGYQGLFSPYLSIGEIEAIFRAGKKLFVLPYRQWLENKNYVMRNLIQLLES